MFQTDRKQGVAYFKDHWRSGVRHSKEHPRPDLHGSPGLVGAYTTCV